MSDTLRPCPHCGKPAAVIEPASGGRPYVMCTVNYCTGPKDTVGEAIASWNRRAPLDPAALLALPEVQAAIDEALVGRLKVRPLEWEDFEGWGAKAVAMLCVNYMIRRWRNGQFEVSVSAPGYGTGFDGEAWRPTLEAAKAAAQADYEARILAALVPPPSAP